MSTQVRIFTVPKSIGETLDQLPQPPVIPRSVPIYPEIPRLSNGSTSPRITPKAPAMFHDKPLKGGITFAHQDQLAKLPIPGLEETCRRYLTALKPLQSSREHAETRHAVEEFLQSDGPELQEKLRNYAEGRTSYIEQFCKFTSKS